MRRLTSREKPLSADASSVRSAAPSSSGTSTFTYLNIFLTVAPSLFSQSTTLFTTSLISFASPAVMM